jgi:hypothetical protein
MKHYAIGKPNKPIRMFIKNADEAMARLQLASGEVFVEVDRAVDGKISADGKTVVLSGINMVNELSYIRELRTSLLSRCDYTIFPDSSFTPSERSAWMAYRSALRDITNDQPNTTFADIVWPLPPSNLN